MKLVETRRFGVVCVGELRFGGLVALARAFSDAGEQEKALLNELVDGEMESEVIIIQIMEVLPQFAEIVIQHSTGENANEALVISVVDAPAEDVLDLLMAFIEQNNVGTLLGKVLGMLTRLASAISDLSGSSGSTRPTLPSVNV